MSDMDNGPKDPWGVSREQAEGQEMLGVLNNIADDLERMANELGVSYNRDMDPHRKTLSFTIEGGNPKPLQDHAATLVGGMNQQFENTGKEFRLISGKLDQGVYASFVKKREGEEEEE